MKPFNLTHALAAWRNTLAHRRGFTEDDLDELEAHVCDYIDARCAEGVAAEAAFREALRRFGPAAAVESEYAKTYWQKVNHQRRWRAALYDETMMLKNYLTIAWRNLARYKGYSFINIAGLGVGVACCLLILLFIQDEYRYDRHHPDTEQVYRVTREWLRPDGEPVLQLARISAPIGPALEASFPEIEHATRLWATDALISYEDRHFEENDVFFAEPSLFAVFAIDLIHGDPATALDGPNKVILTTEMAAKYFGDRNPLGETLTAYGSVPLEVTGVMEPQPRTSHVHFNFLASLATTEPWFGVERLSQWGSYNNYATYLRLAPNADPDALQSRLPAFLRQHHPVDNQAEDFLYLQRLTDIHLTSHFDDEFAPNGNLTYVYLFAAIAFFVLLIACFNFMNLATARASRRAQEVGVRKALGAERRQLIRQFLGESVLLAALAVGLAVVLVWLVLPAFNDFTGKTVSLLTPGLGWLLGGLAGVTLIVGLLAGSYPALFLSRFDPARVLKGSAQVGWRSRLRTALVVSQFAISVVLLIGMAVVLRQVDYVQQKDLGFDQSQLVVLPMNGHIRSHFEAIRQRLESHAAIDAVTASRLVPSDPLVDHIGVLAEVEGQQARSSLALNPVDFSFTETYGMELLAGRSLSAAIASDSAQAVLLNAAAVRHLGWEAPEAAIGQRLILDGNTLQRTTQVVGVVDDFHFESLHESISPLVLFHLSPALRQMTVRLAPGRIPEALGFLETQWATFRPNYPFTYEFVDASFGQLYEAEQRLARVFGVFAGLAVLIACLGLFGLASFMAERRRKEIGVRLVMGATPWQIVRLLATEFVRLVLWALALALPLAYGLMQWWLGSFAYQMDLPLGLFAGASLATLAIALLTVSYQSLRAAFTDPVRSLRYE